METRTLFGCPLSYGLKRKVEKKNIRRHWRHLFKTESDYVTWFKDMSNIKIGDLVSACAGLNEKITSIEGIYTGIGHGCVLTDVGIDSATNGCTARHCAIGNPKSYEDCVKYRDSMINSTDPVTVEWFKDRYSKMKLNPDGTYCEDFEGSK